MDVRRVKNLMTTFEQKAKLVKILSACLETTGSGVRVVIGHENPDREMQQCTIIVAPFCYRNRTVGALGIVGPTRMHYDRTMTTVEYVARLTSKLLSIN
jgi:heat-inducible transcriptional repressor